jgi:hypothetical protein
MQSLAGGGAGRGGEHAADSVRLAGLEAGGPRITPRSRRHVVPSAL